MQLWAARGQAGPTRPPIVEVATSVTPGRHLSDPAVLDEHWEARARTATASLGGDVVGTNKVSVPSKCAVWTVELASMRLWNPPSAARAGRGRTTLVHHPNQDARSFGLVVQGLHQVRAAPLTQPQIVNRAHVALGDAPKIADQQGADLLLNSERDQTFGSFMMRLVNPAAVTSLDSALLRSVLAPATRAALPWLGRTARCSGSAGLLVA